MKKFFAKFAAVALTGLLTACSFAACDGGNGGNGGGSVSAPILEKSSNGLMSLKKSGDGLTYYSSDKGFASFLNDYYSRHVRDNTDKAIGAVKLGQGWTFQKEWESKYLSWFDSTAKGINGYDAMNNMASGLDSLYVCQYGSVAAVPYMEYLDGTQENVVAMGWPFVYGKQTGNYAADFIDGTYGWTINGASDAGSITDGYWDYTFKGETDERLVYEITGLSESIQYAPLIELAMRFEDLSFDGAKYANIGDIVLSFRMAGGDWVSLSYYRDAIYNVKIDSNSLMCAWFPVYLHPAWQGTLEGLRVEIVPEEGKRLNLVSSMNYVRLETDTRITNANTWYIAAMEEYLSFTGDTVMLERNLQDLRRAMMFQLYALDGVNGLLKTDYIQGKTTTVVEKNKFGMQGNSWYDVIPTGTVNMQANICFYESLLAMAQIEEYAKLAGIVVGDTYVRNPHPFDDGAQDILWTQTPESLRALAETLKTNIRKNVSDGGLWNPETGRFAWAIYDAGSFGAEGTAMDYGHTEYNLMAVMYDIASESQKESIMSWISGERTVAGDQSSGEDIYFLEYAPRLNTRNNSFDSIPVYQLRNFGYDIQNGGSAIHVSYYDVLARDKYYGADNSFVRMKEIQQWYEKVQSAGGDGEDFYRYYYADMVAEYGDVYSMAGGGTIGPVGLDYEFYEAALLYATIPYTYFGLDAKFNCLEISPDLPSGLKYMAMENLMFNNVRYDLFVTNSSAVISGVRGQTDSKVRLTFNIKEGQKVYVNYQETTNYTANNGTITLELPLGQCVVEIK